MREKEEPRTTPGFLLSFAPERCHFLGQHCGESRLVSGEEVVRGRRLVERSQVFSLDRSSFSRLSDILGKTLNRHI